MYNNNTFSINQYATFDATAADNMDSSDNFLSLQDAMEGFAWDTAITSSNSSVDSEEFNGVEWLPDFDVMAGLADFDQVVSSSDDSKEEEHHLDQVNEQPTFAYICQQLMNNSQSSPSAFSSDSNHSQDSSATCSVGSKFDTSKFVKEKKRGKKAKQQEERTVNKRAKKESKELWQHNKFSSSASYLEINTTTPEISISFEVFNTKRRQNGPLASDKNDCQKICEISFVVSNLDTTKTNYVSLKNQLDKEAIYEKEKVTKLYTWIRLKGTEEYLFLYCQTGKTTEVHNIITYEHGRLETRSDHLSKYSGKCSRTASVNRSKSY